MLKLIETKMSMLDEIWIKGFESIHKYIQHFLTTALHSI